MTLFFHYTGRYSGRQIRLPVNVIHIDRKHSVPLANLLTNIFLGVHFPLVYSGWDYRSVMS